MALWEEAQAGTACAKVLRAGSEGLEWPGAQWVWSAGSQGKAVGSGGGVAWGPAPAGPIGWCTTFDF